MSEMKVFDRSKIRRRQAVTVSRQDLVKTGSLFPDHALPTLIEPSMGSLEAVAWAADNRQLVERELARTGGVLLRGFTIHRPEDLEAITRSLAGEPLEYTYRSTPRTQISGRVYTSTEYPHDQSIPLHNEMSYTKSWPRRIFFLCVVPAQQGGETPIASSSAVFERIGEPVRRRMIERGVAYVRNYGAGVDLPWQEVFQSEDRAHVEAYCRDVGIEYEWLGGDRLRTRQVCQAVVSHPDSGEQLWFNQAHLFHIEGLEPGIRESLLTNYAIEDLPRNATYGDGSPIAAEDIAEIGRAYSEVEISFPWQAGDVLILDNMKVAHGRRPFVGPRKVVVSMAQAWGAER